MPADGNFGKVFRLTMKEAGMPWPESIGDEFEKVVNVAGQLIAARAIGKETSALRSVFVTLPKAVVTGTGVQAAAATSVVSLAGTYGAGYVGAVLGSLFVAAWDTWGPASVGKLYAFVRKAERDYGENFTDILVGFMNPAPWASNELMSLTIQRVRAHHASLPNRPNGGGR
jgi:hypothetical protein